LLWSRDAAGISGPAARPGERIVMLDIMLGFASLGLFIMNMPSFAPEHRNFKRSRQGPRRPRRPACDGLKSLDLAPAPSHGADPAEPPGP
jgi:hypothetical protein